MKLTCKYSSTITNGKPSKPVQVQIGFCRQNDTLQMHVASKMKKEKICVSSTNVKKIHDKFKGKGKATIEFKNPTYTIMIAEANVGELEKALRLIKLVSRGGNTNSIDAELSSALPSLKQKDLKLKESITDISEYPKKEGFSASLIDLSINTYKLKSVDPRWFILKHLTRLDLSHNKLGTMDDFDWKKFNKISKLTSLTELVLANNGFTELPWEFIHSIPKGLECLSLNDNKLEWLPDEICDLKNLRVFSAVNNPLDDLPEDFFYNCERLLCVNVSGTNIKSHPAVLRQFRMQFFSSNAVGKDFVSQPPRPKRTIGTLFALASAKIYDYRDVYFWLPFNVRFRMRRELFRCDECYLLFPIESKKGVMLQPIRPTIFSTEVYAPQGSPMQINLINSTCRKCWNKISGIY
uniref:Leucine-rich repeat protein n=1 Tax=Panagrolaimus davidi TaxID=227884 RepID=A0A914P2U5_9BILA